MRAARSVLPLAVLLLGLAACATPEEPPALSPAPAVADAIPSPAGPLGEGQAFAMRVTLDRTNCRWQVPEDAYRCDIAYRVPLRPETAFRAVAVLLQETGGPPDHLRVLVRLAPPTGYALAQPGGWSAPGSQVLYLARPDTRQQWLGTMTADLLLLGRVTPP